MTTIVARYSCPECDLFDTPVTVPARGEEPVVVWLEATIRLLVEDHKRRSPRCHPQSLQDVNIPLVRHAGLLSGAR